MLRQPPKVTKPGAAGNFFRLQREYLAQHAQQGHTSGAGDLTTHGFLPRRVPPKPQAAPATDPGDARYS